MRKGLVAVGVSVVALLVLAAVALALEDGPETRDDIGDGHGTSHQSTVYYDKDTDPFVAHVDRVYFGGRKPANMTPYECCEGGGTTRPCTSAGTAASG